MSLVAYFFMGFAQETNEPDVCRNEGCKLCIMNNFTKIKNVYKDILTSCMYLCTMY